MQSQLCELWFTEKSYMLHLALSNSQVITAPEAWQLHCVFHFAAWLEKQICTLKTKNLGVFMCVSFSLHLHQCFDWLINFMHQIILCIKWKGSFGSYNVFSLVLWTSAFLLLNQVCVPYRHKKIHLEACRSLFIYISVLVFCFFVEINMRKWLVHILEFCDKVC